MKNKTGKSDIGRRREYASFGNTRKGSCLDLTRFVRWPHASASFCAPYAPESEASGNDTSIARYGGSRARDAQPIGNVSGWGENGSRVSRVSRARAA